MSYFLLLNDEQKGPYTIGQVRSMWRSGAVTTNTQYWKDGLPEWLPLSTLSDELDSPEPPPLHAQTPVAKPEQAQPTKSGGASVIMSLFRIAMLFMAVVCVLVGFLFPVAWVLAVICLILGVAIKRLA